MANFEEEVKSNDETKPIIIPTSNQTPDQTPIQTPTTSMLNNVVPLEKSSSFPKIPSTSSLPTKISSGNINRISVSPLRDETNTTKKSNRTSKNTPDYDTDEYSPLLRPPKQEKPKKQPPVCFKFKTNRRKFLDVFRGIAVFFMILIQMQGSSFFF